MLLKDKILIAVLITLISAFTFSLFQNIAYPLLWNDEAETAMFATRILQYGYPKVHDGKNVVYLLELPDKKIGIDAKTDAYIGTAWGHFYFAALGALLAQHVQDIYAKTALLRIPFALFGFFGLIIMAFAVLDIFRKNRARMLTFLIFFFFFELLSVSLVLHLREVRHYSLTIFLSSCVLYAYIKYRFTKKMGYPVYAAVSAISLFFLFNTFSPACFIIIGTICIYEFFMFLRNGDLKTPVFTVIPLSVVLVLALPILAFFRTFQISGEFAKMFPLNLHAYLLRIAGIVDFFRRYEFLYLVIAAHLIMVGFWFSLRISEALRSRTKKVPTTSKKQPFEKHSLGDAEHWVPIHPMLQISNFLSLFCVMYAFVIAKMPVNVIYSRYYIVLQPILIIIMLVDIFIIFEFIIQVQSLHLKRQAGIALAILLSGIFFVGVIGKIAPLKNHIYELSHQYQGPLDCAIPYIKSIYKDPEDLVIATNYEECDYMYYLGSKVTIGYVGNNLEEDLNIEPDIVIPRKRWSYTNGPLASLLQRGNYERLSFPIFDYPVNNIPELSDALPHLFKTRMAESENEYLDIYIRR